MSHASADTAATIDAFTMPARLRAIFGGSIGNLIEWYDFYVYNAFALYFAKQFAAPAATSTQQFVNVFAIYAVGFLVRPIGGFFLGSLADIEGRKAALTLSVTLMCAGSLIIAVLPGYAQIGVAAPLLLLFARLLQGFSLGGEYASSATYLSEIATARHRGFYSSFQYVTLIGGQVLGSLTLLIMQALFTGAAARRLGLAHPVRPRRGAARCSGCICAATWSRAPSSSAAARARTEHPFRELLRHKKEFFLVLGLTMGGTTAFYTYSTYMPTFLVNTVKLTRDQATLISFVTLLLYACMQPLFGALSDVIGRRPVLMWFGILGTLCTVPLLTTLSHTHDFMTALLLILAALTIVSGYTAINAVVKAELFPASMRALGVGLPYAIAASLFGGTAPYVALQLKAWGVEPYFYWYVSGLIFVSLVVYVTMRDTRKTSRIVSD